MNPHDEATARIDAWLRDCSPAVQLSVEDAERLRTSIAQALAQREPWAGAADRLAVAVEASQAAKRAGVSAPEGLRAEYNLLLALDQYRRFRPGSEAAPEAAPLSHAGRYRLAEGLGGNG